MAAIRAAHSVKRIVSASCRPVHESEISSPLQWRLLTQHHL